MNEVAFREEKAMSLEQTLAGIEKRVASVYATYIIGYDELYHSRGRVDLDSYCRTRLALVLAKELMNHMAVEVEDHPLGRRYSVMVPVIRPAEK